MIMKKKILTLLVSLTIVASLAACGSEKGGETQKAEFGNVVKVDDFELNANGDILIADQLNGDQDQHEEFLTTDMTNYGDTTLCKTTIVSKEGHTHIIVQYTVKNIGKEAEIFDKICSLDYNDGYTYEASGQYGTMEDATDDWYDIVNGVEIDPLSTIQCKASFTVPEEVVNNTEASLKLKIGECEYTIR